jgi:hypothetical protein
VKKHLLFVLTGLLLLSVTNNAIAETDTSTFRKLNPFFTLDSYFSFIGRRSADVWGFRAGITWNEQWRFGAGYNKISSDIIEQKVLDNDELQYAKNDTVKARLLFTFFPLMAEYILYRKDPWQLGLPLLIGYGNSYFEYFDRNDEARKILRKGVVATQAGINAQYKVLRWFGVSAGLGYRVLLVNNPDIETNMNSPVFSIGLKIYPGEIIKTIQGRD